MSITMYCTSSEEQNLNSKVKKNDAKSKRKINSY